jgi:hypothetical protein
LVCEVFLVSTTCNRLPEHWMHHQRKVGLGGARGGAPAPWVRPHPRPSCSPLPCSSGLLARPRWLPRQYSGLDVKFGWACLWFCSNTPSRKRILMYFQVCACKTYKYQNSWKMLVKNPISKF